MAETNLTFKVVKYLYVIILLLGLIGSIVLFVVGLYALSDNEDNSAFYENIMRYYGIDELNFEPVFNDTNINNNVFNHNNSSYSEDNNLNKQSVLHSKENPMSAEISRKDSNDFLGTIMVFVGIVSVIFELIGLIGAIRHNLVITLTILVLMIVGTVSGLFTIKTIDIWTLITQLFFIVLALIYVILLKKELTRDERIRGLVSNTFTTDLEMNRNGLKRESMEKYITLKSGPLPYKDNDIRKQNNI